MVDSARRQRAEPEAVGTSRKRSRVARNRAERGRRQRRFAGKIVLAVVAVVVLVAVFVGAKLWHTVFGAGDDYAGNGKQDIVIQIKDGDSTTNVGETLQHEQVVKTVRAFVNAAHGNSKISSIQPGFYRMRTEIPAADAVARLADPNSRVGRLVIPEGRQLDDTTDMKTNVVTPGILTLISRATCVTLDGNQHCVAVEELRAAATNSAPAALAVPPWAVEPFTELGKDHRRIEGLIAPGTFNVDPSASAETILSSLISAGGVEYMKSGLVDTAQSMGLSPYDILVVASLVEQESKSQDFAKVAQVIYNRLHAHHTLEFDSTVNYPLDRREVATTDADRAQKTPWNTYVSQGLPATAICSPGVDALRAAEHPEPGDWLYFVTIDAQGTTLFTKDYQQHLANIELAKRNGVLDSAR
ncbi:MULTISPECIES: endolytic transglycosylase MltG [unclassified Mycobacterium]|uniref:endolytic transglycosylase MltG n=1 Tax=unclassified Mycobacterium TaxID=2642494 RepID=UPI0007FDF227|nr:MULTISPECIES: endolytic transglycosylase MltG [unclassified Mycobacterium]OBG59681.1 aminodeoxychorismate lyase [Mycobacterium sp. E188]OBG67920.1 aminodeoxychorismate lyase [Mycobacterium sp. E735]OBG74811.1 aminodeoxychorismate lyase [Mycobacterium sp. E3298]OBG77211.1 aminodeoxychorismate lyase [Mycobacterium sp. E3305]OBH33712.1 aminodeoxychorismate lyase [Mycobacterium sp. E183]